MKAKKINLNNPIHRWKAPTPAFFKKIIGICITIGSVGAGILLLQTTDIVLPEQLITISTYMVTIGAIGTVISKATVDHNKLKSPEDIEIERLKTDLAGYEMLYDDMTEDDRKRPAGIRMMARIKTTKKQIEKLEDQQ